MNPALYRTLWHVKHWRDRDLLGTLRQVAANEWLSADELAVMAWEKQKRLVAHAYASSPYYRKKYDAVGFQPGDLKTPEDFARLPILTKDEIREHIEEMVAQGVDRARLRQKFTSGSTGVPAMLYHDAWNDVPMGAISRRTAARWGIRLGDKIAHIWGLNRLNQQYLYNSQPWWHRALKNYVLLDAWDMPQEKMREFAQLLRGFQPHLIIGYTSAMTAFAEYLENSGGAGFIPRAIWISAEMTFDFQTDLLERVFQAPVYDQYGAVEMLYYAAECSYREGLHIESDFRTLEVVDEAGRPLPSGETGQIIVTDLMNYGAPLIRYRNEDLGRLMDRQCSCGRGLPLMDKVTGRVFDMFILPDGSQLYGHWFVTFFFGHVDKVKAFQVHQTAKDHVVVRMVPTGACDREVLSALALKRFQDHTKGLVHFELQFVDNIPKEASGKYRFVKSDVSLGHR